MELSLVNLLMFFSELCSYVFSSLIALLTLVKFLVKEHNAVTDPGFSRGAPIRRGSYGQSWIHPHGDRHLNWKRYYFYIWYKRAFWHKSVGQMQIVQEQGTFVLKTRHR